GLWCGGRAGNRAHNHLRLISLRSEHLPRAGDVYLRRLGSHQASPSIPLVCPFGTAMHGVRSRIAPPWLQLHPARSPSLSLAFSGRAWCRGYGFAETPAVAPRDSAARHVGEVRSGKGTTSTRSSRSVAMRRRGIRHTHATVRPSSISWQSRERLGHAHVLFLAPRHRTLDDP